MDEEDKLLAEDTVENALQYLRTSEPTSAYSRNKWRKLLKNELAFLQENFPHSYVLFLDISDISLDQERG